MKFTVKHKLGAGFAALVLMPLLVTLLSVAALFWLTEQNLALAEAPVSMGEAVFRIRADVARMHMEMKNLVAAEAPDRAAMSERLLRMYEQDAYNEMRALEGNLAEAHGMTYQRASTALEQWRRLASEVLGLARVGQSAQAEELVRWRASLLADKLDNSLNALGGSAFLSARESQIVQRRDRETAFLSISIASLIVLFLSATLAAYLHGLVIRPVEALLQRVEDHRAGRPQRRATEAGQDELGEVSKCFHEMSEGLRQAEERLAERGPLGADSAEPEPQGTALPQLRRHEVESAGIALVEADSGQCILADCNYAEITGYSAEEMQTRSFLEMVHPADLPAYLDNAAGLQEGRISEFTMQLRHVKKDNTVAWVQATVSPLWHRGVERNCHFVAAHDITIKKLEEQWGSRDQRQRAGDLLSGLSDLYLRLDRDGFVLEGRASVCSPLYRPPQDLLGKRIDVALPEPAGVSVLECLGTVREENFPRTLECAAKAKGGMLFLEARMIPLEEQQIMVLVRDITLTVQELDRLSGEVKAQRALLALSEALLQGDLELKEASERALRTALEITGSPAGFVCARDPQYEQCVCFAMTGKGEGEAACALGARSVKHMLAATRGGEPVPGVLCRALLEGEPFFTNDPKELEEAGLCLALAEEQGAAGLLAGYLAVPVVSEGRTVAQLALANKEGGFDKTDLAAARRIGGLFGAALGRRQEGRGKGDRTEEAEALVRTVNHRIKNHLTMVQSLLSIHSSMAREEALRGTLLEVQNRMMCFLFAHDRRFYSNSTGSRINLADYMLGLLRSLVKRTLEEPGRVHIQADLPPLSLESELVLDLGLIVNELMAYSLREGKAGAEGSVRILAVSLEVKEEGAYCLIVQDSWGKLMDGMEDPEKAASVGALIAGVFIKQIRGHMEAVASERGAGFRLTFPARTGAPA